MKTIKFNEAELEFLQNHYELELLDAENYVAEIKNILKKLGLTEKEAIKEKPSKASGKKRGRPVKDNKPVAEIAAATVLKPVKKEPAKKVPEKKTPAKKAVKKVAKIAAKTVKPVATVAKDQQEPVKPE